MSNVAFYVGLDYHDDGVRVCVMRSGGKVLWNRDVLSDPKAVASAVRKFGRPQGVAIEACGGRWSSGRPCAT